MTKRRPHPETYGHVMGPMIESKGDIDNAIFSTVGKGFQEIIRTLVDHGCVRNQTAKRDKNCDYLSGMTGNSRIVGQRWCPVMSSAVIMRLSVSDEEQTGPGD